MSAPRIVCLEGVHAAGKTTHADHLALELRKAGVYALPWHHPKPPETCRTAYSRALWYALARATFWENEARPASHAEPHPVWIVDRWLWSTRVVAAVTRSDELEALCTAEDLSPLPTVLTILLAAPIGEIKRRLAKRGESTDDVLPAYGEYLRLAEIYGWPAVATTLPRKQVTARLVAIVRGWL